METIATLAILPIPPTKSVGSSQSLVVDLLGHVFLLTFNGEYGSLFMVPIAFVDLPDSFIVLRHKHGVPDGLKLQQLCPCRIIRNIAVDLFKELIWVIRVL